MTLVRTIEAPASITTMNEKQFQMLVVSAAEIFGWHCLHIRNSVANPDGVPDLLMWRGDEYLLVELKTERGKLSPKQERWADDAAARGVAVHLWRPSNWDEQIVPMLRDGPGRAA